MNKVMACPIYPSFNQLSMSLGNQYFNQKYSPTISLSKEFNMHFTQSRKHYGINYMWLGVETNLLKPNQMMGYNFYLFKLEFDRNSILSPGVNYIIEKNESGKTYSILPSIQYQMYVRNHQYLTPKLSFNLGFDVNKNKLNNLNRLYFNIKLMISLNFRKRSICKGNFSGGGPIF